MRIPLWVQVVISLATLAGMIYADVDPHIQAGLILVLATTVMVVSELINRSRTKLAGVSSQTKHQPLQGVERRKTQQMLNERRRSRSQPQCNGPVYTPKQITRIHRSDGSVDEVIDCELVS